MRERGPATNNDMVLAFLRAEIGSPKWGDHYVREMASLRLDQTIIEPPAFAADGNASDRSEILRRVRGYGADAGLFTGFPLNVTWRRVLLDPTELDLLKYINEQPWLTITKGTRSLHDGARNYASDAEKHVAVDEVVQKISQRVSLPEIILVDDTQSRLVILEGNTRATAFVILQRSTAALVGTSPAMRQWHYV